MTTIYYSIFTLIPFLKQNRIQKEKVDFLLAFCESLCNDDGTVDLSVLENTLEDRMEVQGSESENSFYLTSSEKTTNETLMEKFDVVAYSILQDENAKIPFMALHRFISYNTDWIGWTLGIEQTNHRKVPKMRPWDNLPSPPPQPAAIMDKIGENKLNTLMDHQLDWEVLCSHVLASPTPVLAKLLGLRPAYLESEQPYIPPSELSIHKEIKDALEKKILAN